MLRPKTIIMTAMMAATLLMAAPSDANAQGPLLRWLRGLRRPGSNCCFNQTPRFRQFRQTFTEPAVQGSQNANSFGLQPGQCMRTCQQTCSRTVVNYVPQTAYRTTWKRVPVTQFRPVTSSDPCTGCTVTCMRPCTSFTYQMQRVPYTTYRPVYRQETFRVPVTTITNDCAGGTCGTCNTCGPTTTQFAPTPASPSQFAPGGVAPGGLPTPATTTETFLEDPAGGTVPQGSSSVGGSASRTPANQVPALQGIPNPQSSQRPILETWNSANNIQASAIEPVDEVSVPATINIDDKTARSPIHKRWSYSPVRLASHTTSTNRPATRRELNPIAPKTNWVKAAPPKNSLNGWTEVE